MYSATIARLISGLRTLSPQATFYIPLGVGFHVDHQIVHTAARSTAHQRIQFYEDFPYVAEQGALERRLAFLGEPLESRTIAIDALLPRKLDAIIAYASQLNQMFGGIAPMIQDVIAFAELRRPAGGVYGERLWHDARDTAVQP